MAFDSVSHKFVDETLVECRVSNKIRAMFRAVYSSASTYTTVSAPDNKTVKSDVFDIRRGVVQGDITFETSRRRCTSSRHWKPSCDGTTTDPTKELSSATQSSTPWGMRTTLSWWTTATTRVSTGHHSVSPPSRRAPGKT